MPATLDATKIQLIEKEATTTPITRISSYLQDNLGQKLTAYVAGLADPKAVGSWIRGTNIPRDITATRLRYAYQAVRMITEAYDAETSKAWFLGTNTRLSDNAPAYLLRYAKDVGDLRDLVPTARAFAGSAE